MMNGSPSDILQSALTVSWDVDESTDAEQLRASPLGKFCAALADGDESRQTMRLLALSVAKRVLPCWQLYCDGRDPIDAVAAVENRLRESRGFEDLQPLSEPALPSFEGIPIVDCRACDTSCAALAVAHMVRLLLSGDHRELAYCLSAADMAFDQSPLGLQEEFRRWLVEVAVPAALDQRQLTDEEAQMLRRYSVAEIEAARSE
jgi:hypothetical protein